MNADDLKMLCVLLAKTSGNFQCRQESYGIVLEFQFRAGNGELFGSTLCPTEGLSGWLEMIDGEYERIK